MVSNIVKRMLYLPGSVQWMRCYLSVCQLPSKELPASRLLIIGRSRGHCQHPPPQQDQFLSFSHMFLPKSVCIGGWHPPMGQHPPPPMGNPGSATAYIHLCKCICDTICVLHVLSHQCQWRIQDSPLGGC